jgi:sporulation protein YlmC with PRC-barrel domain
MSDDDSDRMRLAYRLLDEQIVDVDGRRCGRVDDLELRGDPPAVTALIVGIGRHPERLPRVLRPLARRLIGPTTWGKNILRVPWEEIDTIDTAVHLRGKAEELGLGQGDDPGRWIVSRLPWN